MITVGLTGGIGSGKSTVSRMLEARGAVILDADVLARIQNNSLKCDADEQPLTIAEVFRCLTDGIWSEFAAAPKNDKDKAPSIATSIVRRNLQREHLKELTNLVLGQSQSGGMFTIMFSIGGGGGGSAPQDARSLARLHLRRINEHIGKALKEANNLEDTTRAHLEECQERIAKVLSASLQIRE